MKSVVTLNILLLVLCGGGLGFYLIDANAATAEQYHILALRNQIAHLNEERDALTLEKSATENPAAAEAFAQNQRMVEAKDIIYVFENGNVALGK